jgi:hypothetical protein
MGGVRVLYKYKWPTQKKTLNAIPLVSNLGNHESNGSNWKAFWDVKATEFHLVIIMARDGKEFDD